MIQDVNNINNKYYSLTNGTFNPSTNVRINVPQHEWVLDSEVIPAGTYRFSLTDEPVSIDGVYQNGYGYNGIIRLDNEWFFEKIN